MIDTTIMPTFTISDAAPGPLAHVVLTADDLEWRLGPTPWPDARPVVAAALEHLPQIADDDTAAVVEFLALSLADLKAERDALAHLLRLSLALGHEHHIEHERMRSRYHELLDARRPG